MSTVDKKTLSFTLNDVVGLLVVVVASAITWGVTKSDIASAQTTAKEASETVKRHDQTLSAIHTDLSLLQDDQAEIEVAVAAHTDILRRQTIILERMAMKMDISTAVPK